jgi:hypothetical protein
MAKWVYNRPLDCCDETELRVAKLLARLPDDWVVCWGFYYDTDREGDFIILGPYGGLLVLEVKGGQLRKLGATGCWDGEERDHPRTQLCAEWRAVINRLNSVANGRNGPFVAKALGLPDVVLPPGDSPYKGIDRKLVLDGNDLSNFQNSWSRLFQGHAQRVGSESREVFLQAYGQDVTPKAVHHFITETDRLLLRHAVQEFELLDMLRDNRHLLVQGGPGTGKTWLALEQAYRLAEAGQGSEVLLLCYNRALARTLGELVSKRKARRGRIAVQSWETLARELFGWAKIPWKEPEDNEDRRRYFTEVVPGTMLKIAGDRKCLPRFQALVVDEGQDHDTAFAGATEGSDGAGWWNIYWKLLSGGNGAPMAVFYDPGQRPLFRDPAAFDAGRLRRHLSECVHVHLCNALRYTGPVFCFLKGLQSETTALLVTEMRHRGRLVEGSGVELYQAEGEKLPAKVSEIVTRWIGGGFCRADEILILSPHGQQSRSGLAGRDMIGAWKLSEHERKEPGQISFLSVNKAKGLDSLAVILIDLRPFSELREAQDRMDYFMGASRARQLLAVVHSSGGPVEK